VVDGEVEHPLLGRCEHARLGRKRLAGTDLSPALGIVVGEPGRVAEPLE
jgi:hypothetical protein